MHHRSCFVSAASQLGRIRRAVDGVASGRRVGKRKTYGFTGLRMQPRGECQKNIKIAFLFAKEFPNQVAEFSMEQVRQH